MSSLLKCIVDWQGSASLDEVFDFCDRLCRTYLEANADLRLELRKAVAAQPKVRNSLLYSSLNQVGPGGYLVQVAKLAEMTRDYTTYLRSALLAISLTDGFDDSRDTLMWLAELWREVEEKGVDPESHYQEIGEISGTEAVYVIGGPTGAMILQMLDAAPERRAEVAVASHVFH